MELTPRELVVLADHYQELIKTALSTWPRNRETEDRLRAVQARLGAILALEASACPLETPERAPRVLVPDGPLPSA